jgi:putative transposase
VESLSLPVRERGLGADADTRVLPPEWEGKQGRLERHYGGVADTFGPTQHVTSPDSRRDLRTIEEFPEVENASRFRHSPLTEESARWT